MHELDPLAVGTSIGLLVLVFARAILHKITDYGKLRQTVIDYRIAPERLAGPVTAALTCAESLTLASLLTPGFRGVGTLAAALLLLAYGAAMAINLARGRTSIDCGCGGPGQSISWILVGRNVLLAGFAGVAAAPVVVRPFDVSDVMLMPTVLGAAWLLLLVCERLLQTFSHVRSVGAYRRGYKGRT
ncbi:hypothetical protein EN962_25280 [Mesorhizobium sp. M7A.F.Ca.CA.001.09.2.1]|uniref:Methylamine utilization protein MauE n=1 Tax=Mesorhizobium ciceri TaxID=39645 RepID=A0AB38TEY5_9HYPH|nr:MULTISPECIES: MauE/DoxX family redox-associated membrane protein [Mesorhizobium]RUY34873.1 hypothetical protein EN981_27110 [Mesorhizobium sp. M7A.F.Ca.CA.001.13.2.1]MDF3218611.1 MauE/DoxX family redox-associated membrane protein [Mesorhizobium ciceri]RUY62792.1 hypothetical protein EN980_29705 [Mesorhizobium sp. M7A.F.Ca.CA.001.13.1.1]RUY63087.1 hypothetical protein EN965_23785 [Mesorhizobium sp. M7A.F.Ca.CA.001.05.1.1]RUY74917.1 hypothetical protein EN962_25280 [Mesorhizobium sp. M7A.F.Ca